MPMPSLMDRSLPVAASFSSTSSEEICRRMFLSGQIFDSSEGIRNREVLFYPSPIGYFFFPPVNSSEQVPADRLSSEGLVEAIDLERRGARLKRCGPSSPPGLALPRFLSCFLPFA